MGIGDLIRNARASIGLPAGTIGLITSVQVGNCITLYRIIWHGGRRCPRLERDLEVIG